MENILEIIRLQTWIWPTLKVLVLILATLVLARVVTGLVHRYTEKNRNVLPPTSIFTNLTRMAVFSIGLLVILESVGISITPILTALGVGGLAVALALQSTLENLFSGLQIIFSRQLSPGDFVELESGQKGFVHDIAWRNTTIRTLANNMIIVPNAKLAAAVIINYNQPETPMSVPVEVGVAYDSDLEKVEAVTIDVGENIMREIDGGVPDFKPSIRYHTFNSSSVDFTVSLRSRKFADHYLIKHEFIKQLRKRFEKEGIEIPFPTRTVHLKKEA